MSVEQRVNLNRLVIVGVATMLWVGGLRALLPEFGVTQAMVMAVWIAMGSRHYAKALSDFQRPLDLKTLAGLALLAPGWPILYWQSLSFDATKARRRSSGEDEDA